MNNTDSMKEIHLRGFAAVPWESVLNRLLLEKHYDKKKRKSSRTLLWRLIRSCFTETGRYRLEQQHSQILFFISFIARKSVVDNFMKVRGLVNSDLLIKEEGYSRFSLWQGLRMMPLLVSWNKSVKVFSLDRSDRYGLLSEIVRLYRCIRNWKSCLQTIVCLLHSMILSCLNRMELNISDYYLLNLPCYNTVSLHHGERIISLIVG